MKQLEDGKVLGYLYFPDTFSTDTHERLINGNADSNNNTLKAVFDASSNIFK
jgi:hypothetical protein